VIQFTAAAGGSQVPGSRVRLPVEASAADAAAGSCANGNWTLESWGAVDRVELTIEGMTCDHCVRAVRNRLAETPGVEVERVEVGSAVIRLDPRATSLETIEDAIADEGYTAYPAG
jgi:copper chaperone